jgi:hypothetical protein
MFPVPVFFLFFFVPLATSKSRTVPCVGIPMKGVVGPLPEKGMNLVHLAEFAAYSISTPYATIAFLIL